MSETAAATPIERVQLGVRMEKRMVKVLKGLAEFYGITLGQLLERIVLHSFEPVPGEEGEAAASPHGKRALVAIAQLKQLYGMDYDVHAIPTASTQTAPIPRPGAPAANEPNSGRVRSS